eukprot:111488-Chlamydomonas_euryale.AAC.2
MPAGLFTAGPTAGPLDRPPDRSFDESSVLRSEMARKNMYIKADEPSVKRARTAPAAPPVAAAPGGGPAGDNPPCNTLFVGNLGDNTTEEELRSVFEATPVRAACCGAATLPSAEGSTRSSFRGGVRLV